MAVRTAGVHTPAVSAARAACRGVGRSSRRRGCAPPRAYRARRSSSLWRHRGVPWVRRRRSVARLGEVATGAPMAVAAAGAAGAAVIPRHQCLLLSRRLRRHLHRHRRRLRHRLHRHQIRLRSLRLSAAAAFGCMCMACGVPRVPCRDLTTKVRVLERREGGRERATCKCKDVCLSFRFPAGAAGGASARRASSLDWGTGVVACGGAVHGAVARRSDGSRRAGGAAPGRADTRVFRIRPARGAMLS